MIVERSMREDYLSNTYLVAAAEGGEAFFVDAGGPVAPLIEKADELDLTPTHVLLTHRHGDHVEELRGPARALARPAGARASRRGGARASPARWRAARRSTSPA